MNRVVENFNCLKPRFWFELEKALKLPTRILLIGFESCPEFSQNMAFLLPKTSISDVQLQVEHNPFDMILLTKAPSDRTLIFPF